MTPVLPVERGLELLRAAAVEALGKEGHFEDARRRDEILRAAQRESRPLSHDEYKELGKLHKQHTKRLKALDDDLPAVYVAAQLAELGPYAKAAITRGRFFIEDEVKLADQLQELAEIIRKAYFPEIRDEHFVLALQPGSVALPEGWSRGDVRLGYAPIGAETLVTAVRAKIASGVGECDYAKMLAELERLSGDAPPVSVRGSRRAQRRRWRLSTAAAWIHGPAALGVGGPMEVLQATYHAHAASMKGLSAHPPALLYVLMRTLEAFCRMRTALSDARYSPATHKISFVRAAFLHAVIAHGLCRVRDAFDAAFPQLSNIVAGADTTEPTLARRPGAAMYRQKPLLDEKRQALGLEAVEGVELRLDCALAHAWMNVQLESSRGGTHPKMKHHRAMIAGLAHETYSHVFYAAKDDVGFRVQHHLVYAWAQISGLRTDHYEIEGMWPPSDIGGATSAIDRARADLAAASGLLGNTSGLLGAISERFRGGPIPVTNAFEELVERLAARLGPLGYVQTLAELDRARYGSFRGAHQPVDVSDKHFAEMLGLSRRPAEAWASTPLTLEVATMRRAQLVVFALEELPVAALYFALECVMAYAEGIRIQVTIERGKNGGKHISRTLCGSFEAQEALCQAVQRTATAYGATLGVGDRLERLALATL